MKTLFQTIVTITTVTWCIAGSIANKMRGFPTEPVWWSPRGLLHDVSPVLHGVVVFGVVPILVIMLIVRHVHRNSR